MKLIIFLLPAFLVFGCVSEKIEPMGDDKNEMPKTIEWVYGKNEYNMEMDSTLRNFLIHVPQKYTDNTPVPVVFMLHGSTGTGTKFYNISGWVQKANEEGFIAVFPTALQYPIVEKNNRLATKWSSGGLASQIPEGYPIKDDIPFFKELIALLDNSFMIDKSRLYISGFSNGGGFVKSRILDEMDDVFAACSGGNIGFFEQMMPAHGRYIPYYAFIGNKDENTVEGFGYEGSLPFNMDTLLLNALVQEKIQNFTNSLQLGPDFVQEPNAPRYNLITWSDDLSGQGNEAKLMIINNLEHKYPNGNNNQAGVSAPDILWDWFNKWSL